MKTNRIITFTAVLGLLLGSSAAYAYHLYANQNIVHSDPGPGALELTLAGSPEAIFGFGLPVSLRVDLQDLAGSQASHLRAGIALPAGVTVLRGEVLYDGPVPADDVLILEATLKSSGGDLVLRGWAEVLEAVPFEQVVGTLAASGSGTQTQPDNSTAVYGGPDNQTTPPPSALDPSATAGSQEESAELLVRTSSPGVLLTITGNATAAASQLADDPGAPFTASLIPSGDDASVWLEITSNQAMLVSWILHGASDGPEFYLTDGEPVGEAALPEGDVLRVPLAVTFGGDGRFTLSVEAVTDGSVHGGHRGDAVTFEVRQGEVRVIGATPEPISS